jgi:hypothetical protein
MDNYAGFCTSVAVTAKMKTEIKTNQEGMEANIEVNSEKSGPLTKYVDQSRRNENLNRCCRLLDGCLARSNKELLRSDRGLYNKDGGQEPWEARSKTCLGVNVTDLEVNSEEIEATAMHQEPPNKATVESIRALKD